MIIYSFLFIIFINDTVNNINIIFLYYNNSNILLLKLLRNIIVIILTQIKIIIKFKLTIISYFIE